MTSKEIAYHKTLATLATYLDVYRLTGKTQIIYRTPSDMWQYQIARLLDHLASDIANRNIV